MKISARRAPSSKESDSSCTSRHTPHARASARDAGARDHGADGDGCARRDLVAAYTRGRSDRGSRIDAAVRAMEERDPRPVLARGGSDDSITTSVANEPGNPSETSERVAPTSPVPRPPRTRGSGRRATPGDSHGRTRPSSPPQTQRRPRRPTPPPPPLRRRRAKTRRHRRRGRRRPARRRGNPTARLSNLERTRRVRAWGSNGRRRGGRAQTSTETNRGRANGGDEAGMSRFLAKYGLESAAIFPTR